MVIRDIQKEIYRNAHEKGWWDKERSFGELIALCHSELSEALEEYRKGKLTFYIKDGKPEGIVSELADVIIRVLDMCEHNVWDIEQAIKVKMEYNKTRPYRHGGKAI